MYNFTVPSVLKAWIEQSLGESKASRKQMADLVNGMEGERAAPGFAGCRCKGQ